MVSLDEILKIKRIAIPPLPHPVAFYLHPKSPTETDLAKIQNLRERQDVLLVELQL